MYIEYGFDKKVHSGNNSGSKLKKLGWTMKYDIKSGIRKTIDILTDSGRIVHV